MVINKSFIEMMGFIYKYDTNGINISLFESYLGLDIASFKTSEEFLEAALMRLEEKEQDFLEIKEKIEWEEGKELWLSQNYYIQNFSRIALFFDNFKSYIRLELEKINYFNYEIPEEEKEKLLRETDEREVQIFWEKISDVPKYRNIALWEIQRLFDRNKEKLHIKEQDFLENMISDLKSKYGFERKIEEKDIKNSITLRDTILKENQTVLQTKIPRGEYVKIMNLVLCILEIDRKVVVSDVKNVVATNDEIKIPNTEKYQELTLQRVIELISHEIEGHMVANMNNLTNIWNLRSVSYIAKEEGMAYTLEKLAMGYSLETIPINRHFYRVFIGENYGGEKFKKFLEIINKLDGESLDVEDYILRYKRGKDIEAPWVNPKDKLYGIWVLEIISMIQSWGNPLGLFLAKHGFKDQEVINKIVWNGEKLTPQLLREKGIVLPLLVGELIRYKVLHPTEENKGLLGWFFKHVTDRYGELFDSIWISYKDFVRGYISEFKEEKKQAVKEILGIIWKYT